VSYQYDLQSVKGGAIVTVPQDELTKVGNKVNWGLSVVAVHKVQRGDVVSYRYDLQSVKGGAIVTVEQDEVTK
jgi:hypothetical protein